MSKSKRPAAGKAPTGSNAASPGLNPGEYELDEALVDKIAKLAVEPPTEDEASSDLPGKQRHLRRMVGKDQRQHKDRVVSLAPQHRQRR